MEWVIRQFWDKSIGNDNRLSMAGVVLDTFEISIHLVGVESSVKTPDYIIGHSLGQFEEPQFRHNEYWIERVQKALDVEEHQRSRATGATEYLRDVAANRLAVAQKAIGMLSRIGHPYEYDKRGVILWDIKQWGLAELVLQVVKLPEHSPVDFLIPWVARELSRLVKALIDAMSRSAPAGWRAFRDDYRNACDSLKNKAPAIAQWAKETRTDIGKVDLATALETIKTYEFKTSLVEQGTIVYVFADGWTVQELRTESALNAEGTNMQNCIASYHGEVEEGSARIYSIRDKSGKPHVSMELRSVPLVKDAKIRGTPMSLIIGPPGAELSPEDFIRSPVLMSWYFAQILGKQNDRPIDAYRERAREFIDKVFDKEGFGWVITGGAPKLARFAGRQLNDINFGEISGVNHLDGNEFVGADFTDANLTGCKMVNVNFDSAIFNKARLSEANLTDASAKDAKFEGAICYFTDFRRANLRGASFDSAHCGGAVFDRALLAGANFRYARVDGATFDGAASGASANWEGVELTTVQKEQLKLPMSAPEESSKKVLHLDWRSKR